MELTKEEKDMLEGKYGDGTALAMEIQVGIGEAFRAKRMVEITRAHVALSNQEADLWFVEKLVNGGAKCKVPPTVNPPFNLEYFQEVSSIPADEAEIVQRTREAYKKIGAKLTYNCTPYLEMNIPRPNEITAYSESSATPFINSVYGARTNREAAQSALCAAVTGRVPLYGFLLKENRKGDVLVEVKAELKDDFDYQMLGYCVPKKIDYGIPVFTGFPKNPSPEGLMNLGAQLNTAGAVSIFHVEGVTPEATTLEEAFQGEEPRKKVTVTQDDLDRMREEISSKDGEIDFAMFGCPHLTIDQIAVIAEKLKGRKLTAELWICTSSITKELAIRMGYYEIIRNAGGHIVEDTCIDQPCWHHLYGKVGVTDSPKCAYYTKRRNMEFIIRSISECVEAAVKGVVE